MGDTLPKTHDTVPPILQMYFSIAADWASTFPSGITMNGIWPNGDLPAETTE